MVTKSHTKLVLIITLLMIGFLSMVLYFGLIKPQQEFKRNIKIDGIVLPKSTAVNEFKFLDNHGQPYTQENLKGHWTMVFFGFTNCGMVCPLTMAELNQMYKKLEKELPVDQLPKIVMVSVDPERDSQEKMNQYVTTFNSSFIGIRADIEETVALEKHYTINHTAEVLLFNPDGRLQAYLAYPHKADQMAKDYKLLLTTFSS